MKPPLTDKNAIPPLPWVLGGDMIYSALESFPNPKSEPRGRAVAKLAHDWREAHSHLCNEPRTTWKAAEQAAHLILTAVNSHAALLAACEAAVDFFHDSDIAHSGRGEQIIEDLRAAIGRATE